jgi:hypothetical protein
MEKKNGLEKRMVKLIYLFLMMHSKDGPARSKEDLACQRRHSKDDPARSKEDLACKRLYF